MSNANQQNGSALPLSNLILSYRISKSTLWGGGFVAAFFTMNLPLFPFLGGDYQPILFVLLVLLALIAKGNVRREVVLPFFGLALSLLGVSLWHATQQSLDIISLIRCSAGLLFVLGAPTLIAQVPLGAFRMVVWVHVLFAIFGLIYPEGAAGVVNALGLRGVVYYDGWNAFFSSEPSYAALNLAAVIALAKLKTGVEGQPGKTDWMLLMGIFVLLLTKSVTGLVLAAILIWPWASGTVKKLSVMKFLLVASIGFGLLSILFLMLHSSDVAYGSRVVDAGEAVAQVLKGGSLLPFFLMEPSGSWRLLANLGGLSAAFYYPLGTGSLVLQNIILDVLPPVLSDLIQSNFVYGQAVEGFNAQMPLANYAVFGGLLLSTSLLFLTYLAMRSVIRCCDKETRFFVVGYVIVGLLWQGALTAPGWWLVLGYALVVKKKLPKKLNYQATVWDKNCARH